jgi:2',3'-cyclic-nucleotide 2'-phosphodiesterase (5'-nucleotidase family)
MNFLKGTPASLRVRAGVLGFLLAACLTAQAQIRSLTILHTNDLHAHLLPDSGGSGGFAQLAAILRHETDGCLSCLILNGGDLVQGTPVSTIFQGLPIYEVANLLRFDASVLGNHEFDYGWRKIEEFRKAAQFPLLAANVTDGRGKLLTDEPYVIREVSGLRVAIIGVLTTDLPDLTTADLIGPWRVLPVVETARRYAGELREKADVILVLGHLNEQEEDAILREAPEVAAVISGHAHAGLEVPKQEDGRVAVRVKAYGVEVGRLDLEVDVAAKAVVRSSWRRIPVVPALPRAEDVSRAVDQWESKVTRIVDTRIGTARRMFDRQELQPLLEQALREETGTDLAFINMGGIRDVLPQGTILARHIWNIEPFDDRIVIGEFLGRDLPAVITSRYPVQADQKYTLAVADFVATNQHAEFGATGLQFPKQTNRLVRDAVIEWIKKKKVLE